MNIHLKKSVVLINDAQKVKLKIKRLCMNFFLNIYLIVYNKRLQNHLYSSFKQGISQHFLAEQLCMFPGTMKRNSTKP